jgi:hypothetical protein
VMEYYIIFVKRSIYEQIRSRRGPRTRPRRDPRTRPRRNSRTRPRRNSRTPFKKTDEESRCTSTEDDGIAGEWIHGR